MMNGLDKRSLIIEQAAKIVEGARQEKYGSPEDNFKRIAVLWENYLAGRKEQNLWCIEPSDVCMMMILVKLARLMNTPNHWDSIKDVIGYATCMASFVNEEDVDKGEN